MVWLSQEYHSSSFFFSQQVFARLLVCIGILPTTALVGVSCVIGIPSLAGGIGVRCGPRRLLFASSGGHCTLAGLHRAVFAFFLLAGLHQKVVLLWLSFWGIVYDSELVLRFSSLHQYVVCRVAST